MYFEGPLPRGKPLGCYPKEILLLDIVFRFIIEYSSLREVGPQVGNMSIFISRFLKDDILDVLKLEINYQIIVS